MNENIDLTKILENCPTGTKLDTTVCGEVTFIRKKKNKNCSFPICIDTNASISYTNLTKDGRYLINRTGTECILFPSKDQRDWSKFTAPWYKTEKFDSKTLKPFDKVIARDDIGCTWKCDLFSYIIKSPTRYSYRCVGNAYAHCIPCNDDTKHLVGTTEEAPEYYRYWDD